MGIAPVALLLVSLGRNCFVISTDGKTSGKQGAERWILLSMLLDLLCVMGRRCSHSPAVAVTTTCRQPGTWSWAKRHFPTLYTSQTLLTPSLNA